MKHNVITRTTLQTFMKTATMGFIVLASTLFAPHTSDTAAADSPNIILILTDDQGWSQRSGLMDPENPKSGSSYLHTPAMDRIGIALKEKTDSLNLEAHLKYPGFKPQYESLVEFFMAKLLDE